MWVVTIMKGDYRMPIAFRAYQSAIDFVGSVFDSEDLRELHVVLSYAPIGEEA